MSGPRVLVVTVVHTPSDARILDRQIGAMREDDLTVTYAAPFAARGVAPPEGLDTVDLPRATGRRRLAAVRAARELIRIRAPRTDLVLLHDPDLLLSVAGLDGLPPVVWDVHEDTAAALADRDWVPDALRPVARRAVHAAERRAEERHHLILAEDRYADRFTRPHPVIHNYPRVPEAVAPPGPRRVVYVGRISPSRGSSELVELGTRLAPDVEVDVVGWADGGAERVLRPAADAGAIRWTGGGYVPNDEALAHVRGATAGLSLLHDQPNYRHSLPTKVIEYMAHGVPVVTTPLPAAAELVERYGCGVVVPFGDVDAVERAVRELHDDRARREELGRRGHRAASRDLNWDNEGSRFVELLRGWAG